MAAADEDTYTLMIVMIRKVTRGGIKKMMHEKIIDKTCI